MLKNTTHTMIAILTLGIFMGFGTAYAETLVIEGSNEEEGIYISIDGDRNTIILDTIDNPILDSKMKMYNTGAFNLKNSEKNVSVWVHPFSDTEYRIVVKSSDGTHNIQKIIGINVVSDKDVEQLDIPEKQAVGQRDLLAEMQQLEEDSISETTETEQNLIDYENQLQDDIDNLENNSNSDLTEESILAAWEASKNQTQALIVDANGTEIIIPNISRDGEQSFLMTFNKLTFLDNMQLNDEFELMGYVYNVRDASRLDADLTFEISRDGYPLKSLKTKTGSFGTVVIEIQEMIYPLFYPGKCYYVKLTMEYENYTTVWTDEFVMGYPSGGGVWQPDMSWQDESRFNYLPQSFADEPRQSIPEDKNCI